VTTATGGSSFTAAEYAYICVEAGAANNFSDCFGILMGSKETGAGENSFGANAEIILGNCVLYEGVLTNVDAAARTDISATLTGQYLYIR
jgi:hypothetical protein